VSRIRWPAGRLTYANVTATLALFMACGGVAVAGTKLIDGSSIKPRSLPGDRLKLHTLTTAEIRIPKERLVGGAGEPPFGAGWKNAGAGYQLAGFYRDQEGVVHLRGVVSLGGSGLTIFTLPAGYRPSATEAFSAVLDSAGSALILVTAAGDVDLEFVNSPSTPHALSLSQISFRVGV
jgi:hypothetical protein